MKEFIKRYRYFLRNGFDVVEAAYIAAWTKKNSQVVNV